MAVLTARPWFAPRAVMCLALTAGPLGCSDAPSSDDELGLTAGSSSADPPLAPDTSPRPGCKTSPCGMETAKRGDVVELRCGANNFPKDDRAFDRFVNVVCNASRMEKGWPLYAMVLGRWRSKDGKARVQFAVPVTRGAADRVFQQFVDQQGECAEPTFVTYATSNNKNRRSERCHALPYVTCGTLTERAGAAFAELGQPIDPDCENVLSFDPWEFAVLNFLRNVFW